jgi:ribonucleoside-triphosphate reductase
MIVMKRDGREDHYSKTKIFNAINKAVKEVTHGEGDESLATKITTRLESRYRKRNRAISVEEIQDDIETELMKEQAFDIAKAYITYRYEHALLRNSNSLDGKIMTIVNGVNEEIIQENSNKNPTINSTQRDYIAGEVSRDLTRKLLLPDDIRQAHDDGIIHFHDSDYFVQHEHNCCLVNLEDMLQNGTVISGTLIEKPHSFATACNIATQAIAQIASNQYGGQSISLTHLAPFVDVSRQRIKKQVEEEIKSCGGDINKVDEIVQGRLKEEINRGVQMIQYQVLTLMTTNGQTPFITVFMYLNEAKDQQTKDDLAMIIEETVRQRYQGVKNEKGVWITPAFPKLIYVLEEDNITEDSKYWYLTKLCAQCSIKRLVPDYISEKVMLESKIDSNGEGHCFPCMGCRSFLTPYIDENGNPKYYGRFNQGVVTINLPDVGLSTVKEMEGLTYVDDEQYQKRKEETFWRIFDERLELCHRALRLRHERLLGTLSDASPIHWQYGGLARLKKGETIDKLLYGGYSTLSLGYAGLSECVKAMTGKSHTNPEAEPFALQIMQHMNDKCEEWKKAEDIAYSLYGTPIESTTYKFAKCLQRRFGVIEGITDKKYITNSYHVHVTEKINAFDKLAFESKFQRLSPGGAISYIETANLSDNVDAALAVIKFIYDNIMYAELNTKSDYCQVCGYDGEIQIVENDDGKLIWKCPKCGNTDRNKMNIARRTCGYIGVNDFNQGRTQEIKERYVHLGGD